MRVCSLFYPALSLHLFSLAFSIPPLLFSCSSHCLSLPLSPSPPLPIHDSCGCRTSSAATARPCTSCSSRSSSAPMKQSWRPGQGCAGARVMLLMLLMVLMVLWVLVLGWWMWEEVGEGGTGGAWARGGRKSEDRRCWLETRARPPPSPPPSHQQRPQRHHQQHQQQQQRQKCSSSGLHCRRAAQRTRGAGRSSPWSRWPWRSTYRYICVDVCGCMVIYMATCTMGVYMLYVNLHLCLYFKYYV